MAISAKRKEETLDVDMDKAIESGIKELNTKPPSDEVARYGVVLDDGRWLPLNNTACHAGLSNLKHWKEEGPYDYNTRTRGPAVTVPPKVVINQVQKIKGDEEAATRFYEWLLNYSPFSSVFMHKTGKRVVEDHIIIGDCEAPANLLTGGMMASRLPTEFKTPVSVWDRLVNLGVHPNAAFVAAHAFTTAKFDTIAYAGISHTAIHVGAMYSIPEKDENTFWNFLRGKPTGVGKPYREALCYGGIDMMWYTKNTPITVAQPLLKIKEAMCKVGGKKGKTNPFAVTKNVEIPFNEGIEEIALTIKNIISKDNALAA